MLYFNFSSKKGRRRILPLCLCLALILSCIFPAFATDSSLEAGNLLKTGTHDYYMSGVDSDHFSPDETMTRAEAAMVIYKLLISQPESPPAIFADVSDPGSWYYDAVNALADIGIVSGVGDGMFNPQGELTRAEFVTMLCKCFGIASGESVFDDVPESHWAYDYISAAADAGWISGIGGGLFAPDQGLKRAEAVAIVNRAIGRTGEGYAIDRDRQKFSDVSPEKWYFLDVTEAASPVKSYIISGTRLRVTSIDGLNLRSQPSLSSDPVETVSLNTVLTAKGTEKDGWVEAVSPSGSTGYVSSDYLAVQPGTGGVNPTPSTTPTPTPAPTSTPTPAPTREPLSGLKVRVVSDEGLNLRSSPEDGEIISTIDNGSILTLIDIENLLWPKVRTADGKEGYVSSEFLELVPGMPESTPSPTPKPTAKPTASPSPTPTPTPEGFAAGVQARVASEDGLNLRASPVDGNILSVLSYGSIVTIIDVKDPAWPKVRTNRGTEGYVSAEYLELYSEGGSPSQGASNGTLSSSNITIMQYQSFRLDAKVSGSISSMSWSSSDPSVAVVSYTVGYNSSEHGAIVYGVKPGTAVLTFSNADGSTKAQCKVTVTSPEPVRYAYASENAPVSGAQFDLIAVTYPGCDSVTFTLGGKSYTCTDYETQTHTSSYDTLGVNTVRVFRQPVTVNGTGIVDVGASATGSGSVKTFSFYVSPTEAINGQTSLIERRASTKMLKVIENFEGALSEIEDDQLARKNPTVGYGYVVPVNSAFYNNLTEAEMFGMLVDKVNTGGYSAAVNNFIKNNKIKMNQSQFDALVSFVWNCGTGVFNRSIYYVSQTMYNAVVPDAALLNGTANYLGYLNNYGSDIYADTSLSAEKIGEVPEGCTVTVKEARTKFDSSTHEVWYRIEFEGTTGWIPAGYVELNGEFTHDLAYADSIALANNFMQWHTSDGEHYSGLLYRRMAECKIFFFGNYEEAYHDNPNYDINTYNFVFPDCCEEYDQR